MLSLLRSRIRFSSTMGRWVLCLAALGCLGPRQAAAGTLTNVLSVNVTATSFSVLWRADASTTPSIAVFADSAGSTNLAGQVGVEAFPLNTGNPALAAGFDRRQDQASLRQLTQSKGLFLIRVSGCTPSTAYYYRLSSTATNGAVTLYPSSGPLPGVATPAETSFVVNDQQLILDVPGVNARGNVVILSNAASPFSLAAVVGDGAGTNQAFFNVNDLLSASGAGNFTPIDPQIFAVDVVGPAGQSDTFAQISINFSTNFSSTAVSEGSVTGGTEYVAIRLGTNYLRAGQSSGLPINFDASVAVSNLDLTLDVLPGHLTNFVLQGFAAQVDPSLSTVTQGAGSTWLLHLVARSGQSISGSEQVAQLGFAAIPGLHSAFVPVKLQHLVATKAGGIAATNLLGQSGRVVVIGAEALLEAGVAADKSHALTLYGKPAATYAVEFTTNLAAHAAWTRLSQVVPLSASSYTSPVQLPVISSARVFFRAVELTSDPPSLAAGFNSDGSRKITLVGVAGYQYTVYYSTNLSNVAGWQPLVTLTLTNATGAVNVGNTNRQIFYRLQRL